MEAVDGRREQGWLDCLSGCVFRFFCCHWEVRREIFFFAVIFHNNAVLGRFKYEIGFDYCSFQFHSVLGRQIDFRILYLRLKSKNSVLIKIMDCILKNCRLF